jgi:modification methylase
MAAVVLANGQLRHAQLSGSIHEVGQALQGAPCNGWEHWYYLDANAGERHVIDRLREIVRAERTP